MKLGHSSARKFNSASKGNHMAQSLFLFLVTFFLTLAIANSAGPEMDVHVQDAYPSIAFGFGCVVAVLGFLLKFFMTRDRQSIDLKFVEVRGDMKREVDILHKHMEHAEAKTKGYVDGIGIKVDRMAETIEAEIGKAVQELQRHDRELFAKWDALNREFGQLKGEHDTLKTQHNHRTTYGDQNRRQD